MVPEPFPGTLADEEALKHEALPPSLRELAAGLGSSRGLDYSVHVSLQHKFIYFNNPKCGCSLIKAVLNFGEARGRGESLSYRSNADVHDRSKGILMRPSALGWERIVAALGDPAFRKIAFVREPASRVYSAFLNKIAPRSTDEYDKLRKALGLFEGDFDAFLAVLADRKILFLDDHWRPQYAQIGAEHVEHDFIGRFERLEDDVFALYELLFGHPFPEESLDWIRKLTWNPSGASRRLDELSRDQLATIRELYARDFDLFYDGGGSVPRNLSLSHKTAKRPAN